MTRQYGGPVPWYFTNTRQRTLAIQDLEKRVDCLVRTRLLPRQAARNGVCHFLVTVALRTCWTLYTDMKIMVHTFSSIFLIKKLRLMPTLCNQRDVSTILNFDTKTDLQVTTRC